MKGLGRHLATALRLHFRNRMALIYGYLFPLIFLAAFWVLFRHEPVPLLRHAGELLTIGVLGGACFGLPTTMVGERERGLWRRYRLTPVPAWALVASTVVARYLLLVSAGALQLAVALALGMTAPAHPLALAAAFTMVAFAFIGLGLVIAMMADNVPAVQALGQCIFLPMLIIGGVAVPLASLPPWAQRLSAFFPGRYAVEALQAAVSGGGLGTVRFSLAALGVIGAAGCVTGARLFRWDAAQRFAGRHQLAWLLPVLGAWCAVGLLAESRGHVSVAPGAVVDVPPSPWEQLTPDDTAALDFHVPRDDGVVAPIARDGDEPDDYLVAQLDDARRRLPAWPPGLVRDPVQRVRNLLCVAAVADVAQQPAENYLPRIVLVRLLDNYPKATLVKILTWIAQHPGEGTMIDDISDIGVPARAEDPGMVRDRVYLYAIKFVARLTGSPVRQ